MDMKLGLGPAPLQSALGGWGTRLEQKEWGLGLAHPFLGISVSQHIKEMNNCFSVFFLRCQKSSEAAAVCKCAIQELGFRVEPLMSHQQCTCKR